MAKKVASLDTRAAYHVAFLIIATQPWKKVFSVDGKEGRLFLNIGSKFLVSMARKVASLHTTPPPWSGGPVGSLIIAPQLWK